MTSEAHVSGTDRVAEVASRHSEYQVIVNVQGDEPEIEPENIDKLIELQKSSGAAMSTLATPFRGPKEGSGSPLDPACVKVVPGEPLSEKTFFALYFSRSLIPYPRDAGGRVERPEDYLLHLGIYAYSAEFVTKFSRWAPGRTEQIERLEQLRVLEKGERIAVQVVENGPPGIDTPEDYKAFIARCAAKGKQSI